jgi:adenylate kinase family enzyme
MRRVAVIGCGGAGKTTLARELGRRLDLPVLHVDGHYWRGAGARRGGEWAEIHGQLIAGDRWILDGMKPGLLAERLERADTAIFLDLPRRTCLRGVVARRLRHLGRVRSDTGTYDRLERPFLRWIWRFGRDVRPAVDAALGSCGCDVVVLRSRREIDCWVASLPVAGVERAGAQLVPALAGTHS